MAEMISVAKDFGEDAFWIFVGGVVGAVIIAATERFVPQVRQYNDYAMVLVGVIGFILGRNNSILRNAFAGAAVSGFVGVLNTLLNPVLAPAMVMLENKVKGA